MVNLNVYTNLLYREGVITEAQANNIARKMKEIEDHEFNRMKKLDDDFWEQEGL